MLPSSSTAAWNCSGWRPVKRTTLWTSWVMSIEWFLVDFFMVRPGRARSDRMPAALEPRAPKKARDDGLCCTAGVSDGSYAVPAAGAHRVDSRPQRQALVRRGGLSGPEDKQAGVAGIIVGDGGVQSLKVVHLQPA
jgi:hypothetical protein